MKSHGCEECLIIAIELEILDEKRDLVTLVPILERVAPVMMMEGMGEQRSAGHKTKSVNCFHLMGQLTQPSFGDREKSNFNKYLDECNGSSFQTSICKKFNSYSSFLLLGQILNR